MLDNDTKDQTPDVQISSRTTDQKESFFCEVKAWCFINSFQSVSNQYFSDSHLKAFHGTENRESLSCDESISVLLCSVCGDLIGLNRNLLRFRTKRTPNMTAVEISRMSKGTP